MSRRLTFLCPTTVLAFALTLLTSAARAQGQSGPWYQYEVPEEAGFSSAKLEQARRLADSLRSGAVMAIYRGSVVVAWGEVERRFQAHSVRKSFLSALYGIHVANGRIDIQRTLADLGIDDTLGLSATERSGRVVDLLRARSGVYHRAAYSPRGMVDNLPARGSHAPGTFWYYNNWDFNTAGAIFERETGTAIFEEFKRRIADPVGMEDFRVEDGFYALEPSHSWYPAYTFRISARDMARFGQLYLQKGRWNETQVVPAQWVEVSTASHSDIGRGRGYGYMWWVYPAGTISDSLYPTLNRFDKYSATGTGGQFILVVPDAELVIVHRGDTDNNRPVRGRQVWRVAERIAAARERDSRSEPKLTALRAVALSAPAPAPTMRAAVSVDPGLYDDYVGRFDFGTEGVVTVHKYRGRLFALHPDGEAELVPESETKFFLPTESGMTAEFVRADNGQVTELIIRVGGDVVLRGTRAEGGG